MRVHVGGRPRLISKACCEGGRGGAVVHVVRTFWQVTSELCVCRSGARLQMHCMRRKKCAGPCNLKIYVQAASLSLSLSLYLSLSLSLSIYLSLYLCTRLYLPTTIPPPPARSDTHCKNNIKERPGHRRADVGKLIARPKKKPIYRRASESLEAGEGMTLKWFFATSDPTTRRACLTNV